MIELEQNVLICEPTGPDVVPVKFGFPVKFRGVAKSTKSALMTGIAFTLGKLHIVSGYIQG